MYLDDGIERAAISASSYIHILYGHQSTAVLSQGYPPGRGTRGFSGNFACIPYSGRGYPMVEAGGH